MSDELAHCVIPRQKSLCRVAEIAKLFPDGHALRVSTGTAHAVCVTISSWLSLKLIMRRPDDVPSSGQTTRFAVAN